MTLTLYPIVEYVMIYRRNTDSWNRLIIPEISLPRESTVYGKYSISLHTDILANNTHTYSVKIAAVNSAGQMGQWSKLHIFSVYWSDNRFNSDGERFYDILSTFK